MVEPVLLSHVHNLLPIVVYVLQILLLEYVSQCLLYLLVFASPFSVDVHDSSSSDLALKVGILVKKYSTSFGQRQLIQSLGAVGFIVIQSMLIIRSVPTGH